MHTPIDKMSFWGKSVLTHIHTYYIWCRFVHKTRGARVIVIYCGVRCVNCARLAALYNYYIIGAHSCCAHLTSTANYVIITPSNPNRSRLHSLLDKCYKVCNNYTIESQQEPTPWPWPRSAPQSWGYITSMVCVVIARLCAFGGFVATHPPFGLREVGRGVTYLHVPPLNSAQHFPNTKLRNYYTQKISAKNPRNPRYIIITRT